MYDILPYTKRRARDLGVTVTPSKNKNKKLKVVEPSGRVFHVGDIRYADYPTYRQVSPSIADDRRRLYHIRHRGDRGGAGYYARELLW